MISDDNILPAKVKHLIPIDQVERRIYFIRGQRVMLDSDLAKIYGVSTKRLNEQVSRNRKRFPEDFMFQLTKEEADSLRLQNATLEEWLRSHFATLDRGRGKYRKYLPFVFSEHGTVMLSAVLHTPIAIEASIQIARAFVRLREMVASNKKLTHKLAELERKLEHKLGIHDKHIRSLFEAINQLMEPPQKPRAKIGFIPNKDAHKRADIEKGK